MDESLQKSGSWVASFGGVFSPGAEIFRIEHSQQCEVVCQNVAKWGTLILEAHFPVTGITAFGAMSLGN